MKTNVLVTGANGFIGSNLIIGLGRRTDLDIVAVDVDSPESELGKGLDSCEAVFHLAGVNRPGSDEEYEAGNVGVLAGILERLERKQRRPLVVLTSSIQASLDNPYGRSKQRAEQVLMDFAGRTGAPARIFRLPGVFGKWGRPNYNSVVATFCHNIARELPIRLTDPEAKIDLVHVDDVVGSFVRLIGEEIRGAEFDDVQPVFRTTLGELAATLVEFKANRESSRIADLSDPLRRRLFGTFVAYLPPEALACPAAVRSDARGELAELLKAGGHGQIFLSRTRPGITRGNHYHDLKVEKFVVIEGEALIRFRHMFTDEGIEYRVLGSEYRILDIPPGWTHSIENIGTGDLITLFWSSEVFDPANPDTFSAEVLK
jgi:UDP-2-acetamido-2,6-beta-L-arabino-hexul-4-ose reductase